MRVRGYADHGCLVIHSFSQRKVHVWATAPLREEKMR